MSQQQQLHLSSSCTTTTTQPPPHCVSTPLTPLTPPTQPRHQAFATDSNGKQSVADINRLIGVHIKEAASHLGARRVWQSNAAIGKYVKAAAADAAAGKLKVKGQYKAPAAAAPAAAKK